MSFKTIKHVIINDVYDISAAAVSAANSTEWPTAADVDEYAYKSMGTLLFGSTTTCGEMDDRVFFKLGEGGHGNNAGYISIIGVPMEPGFAKKTMYDTNAIGNTVAFVHMKFSLPGNKDWDKMNNMNLRMRYLLDLSWRKRRKLIPFIRPTPKVDKSLSSQGVICAWHGAVGPINAAEVVELWEFGYDTVVPRT